MGVAPINCTMLHKRFGNVIALEEVSFQVSKPSVIGLVGPNGSGKSTLLHLLMGSYEPSNGDVTLFGRSPKTSRRHHLDVGYLSAKDSMFPDLTVLENMIYRGMWYSLNPEEASSAAARLLRDRNLYSLRDKRPGTLSTGQRRQISLLSTLMHQPKILLLDEPTTGIDILAITEIYDLMSRLCDADVTIVLATHSLEELVSLCDRTIALYDGQLIHDSPTGDLGVEHSDVRKSLHRLFQGLPLDSSPDNPVPKPLLVPSPPPEETTPSLATTTGGR